MDFPGTVSRDTKRIPRLGVLEPLVESWFHPLCLQLAKRLRWPTQASAWRPCLQLLHEPIPLTRGIIGQVVLGRDAFNPEGTAKLQRQAPACKPKRNDGHLLLALWHQTLCTMAVWSKARALPASEGAVGKTRTQQHCGTFAHAVLCNCVVRMDHHPPIPYIISKGGHT